MFTSRGWRKSSRENKKYSKTGQIIQKKPVFQIDNNPVVLDAYKKFILDTMPKTLLVGHIHKDTVTVTLSDYNLSWIQTTLLADIYSDLLEFAGNIFLSYQNEGKQAVSLTLYSPNSDDNGWTIMPNYYYPSAPSIPIFEKFNQMFIDTEGNLSFNQYGDGTYNYASTATQNNKQYATIGYAPLSGTSSPTFGSPISMKMDVYYYKIYNTHN